MTSRQVESFARAAMLGLVAAAHSACGASSEEEPEGEVTSSEVMPDLSLDEFSEMCAEAGGDVEIHPSCGGVVSGPGFSYDSDTDVFTEHTCAGVNTCTGFSCVIEG